MNQEQRETILSFGHYIDTLNRTATLAINDQDYGKLQEIHQALRGTHITPCKTCLITALRDLYREANN